MLWLSLLLFMLESAQTSLLHLYTASWDLSQIRRVCDEDEDDDDSDLKTGVGHSAI